VESVLCGKQTGSETAMWREVGYVLLALRSAAGPAGCATVKGSGHRTAGGSGRHLRSRLVTRCQREYTLCAKLFLCEAVQVLTFGEHHCRACVDKAVRRRWCRELRKFRLYGFTITNSCSTSLPMQQPSDLRQRSEVAVRGEIPIPLASVRQRLLGEVCMV